MITPKLWVRTVQEIHLALQQPSQLAVTPPSLAQCYSTCQDLHTDKHKVSCNINEKHLPYKGT